MKNIIITIVILISNVGIAQNSKYYSLEKNGKKFPKIVRFLLIDKDDSKIVNSKKITFYHDSQKFEYITSKHKMDTCNVSVLKNLEVVSIKQLFEDEHKEHLEKTKSENIKFPVMPLNHYNSKVYIIEKIDDERIIKYEVDWIYSIS